MIFFFLNSKAVIENFKNNCISCLLFISFVYLLSTRIHHFNCTIYYNKIDPCLLNYFRFTFLDLYKIQPYIRLKFVIFFQYRRVKKQNFELFYVIVSFFVQKIIHFELQLN